jgi:hypothetical protein
MREEAWTVVYGLYEYDKKEDDGDRRRQREREDEERTGKKGGLSRSCSGALGGCGPWQKEPLLFSTDDQQQHIIHSIMIQIISIFTIPTCSFASLLSLQSSPLAVRMVHVSPNLHFSGQHSSHCRSIDAEPMKLAPQLPLHSLTSNDSNKHPPVQAAEKVSVQLLGPKKPEEEVQSLTE